jgi:hypothetical protein
VVNRRAGVVSVVVGALLVVPAASAGKASDPQAGVEVKLAAPQQAAPRITVVRVQMYEMNFRFSRRTPAGAWTKWTTTVAVPRPGVVEFRTVNVGKAPHDLAFRGLGRTRVLQPNQRQTIRVRFAKRGTYRYICTVEGHVAAGMLGRLAVR